MKKLFFSMNVFVNCFTLCPNHAADKDIATSTMDMLKRIGVTDARKIDTSKYSVAVIDEGNMYQHPSLNGSCITPSPLELPENLSEKDEEHGLNVCSVIHQLNPKLNIIYYQGFGNSNIFRALNNPMINIINCSFSGYGDIPTHYFEEAQEKGKFFVFSASNCAGWLGVNSRNRYFNELAKNEKTRKSFALIGGSENINGEESVSSSFLKAGALRKHYLIAPGVNVPVFSHIPKKNNQKLADGTSFSAPHVVSSLIDLIVLDSNLTPYKAFRKLCKTANPPKTLENASVADQGWGYLNLNNAALSIQTNTLDDSEFSKIYNEHMQRPFLYEIKDIIENKYPENIIIKLKKFNNEDPHVKQLLRVSLYEQGIFLLANNKTEEALKHFEEARELGIHHEDPLTSLTPKKSLLLTQDNQGFSWHKGMILSALEYRKSSSKKDVKLDYKTLQSALDFGYKGAEKLLQDQDLIKFSKINCRDFQSIREYLRINKADSHSIEFQEKIAIYLSQIVSENIKNNIIDKEIKEISDIIIHNLVNTEKVKKCLDLIKFYLITKLSNLDIIDENALETLTYIENKFELKDPNTCAHIVNFCLKLISQIKESDKTIEFNKFCKYYQDALRFAEMISEEYRNGYLSEIYGEWGYYYLACHKENSEIFGADVLNLALKYLQSSIDLGGNYHMDLIKAKYEETKTEFVSLFTKKWF